jgi:membrane protease subunit HflC
MRWKLLLLLAGVLLLARLCLFTVDRSEFVYLTQFGRPIATFDGANEADAGLHWKWPWPVQSVQRLDRRLQVIDLPGAELLTRDTQRNTPDKTLTVDAYVCWRIAETPGSVDRFIRAIGTMEGARDILVRRINSELGEAIGKMELDDLVSTEPGKVDRQRERLRRRLLGVADRAAVAGAACALVGVGAGPGAERPWLTAATVRAEPGLQEALPAAGQSLQQVALAEYGIEVVDVRLRRSNHPPSVRQDIFNRIISERDKKVADYRSEGERRAADITSASNRKVAELQAEAEAEATRLRGLAEAEADSIRGEASAKDPQFYTFLKKLEEYQRFLGDNKSMLLLSTHRELFDVLFNPPTPNGTPRNGGKP